MADTKVSAFPAAAALDGTETIPVVQAGAGERSTIDAVLTYLQTKGLPRVNGLAVSHTLASATGTEVTGLGPRTLEPGTYEFRFQLITQSSLTGTGIGLGINFTGTAAVRTITLAYPSTGTAAITGIMDDVGAGTGQIVEHNVQTAFSTSSPNMVNTAGYATANVNVPVIIQGILVVTASGDLELWHSSETANNTSVMAGSSLIVTRTA